MCNTPIGRISYINVSPVYHGIDNGGCPDWLTLVTRPPAELNAMLKKGDVVMSPVSSAAYARNAADWVLLPDLSISCDGKVLSVLFVSEKPMEELEGERVVATEESETSVDLLRILFRKKGVAPIIEQGKVHVPSDIPKGARGGLVIGDSALLNDWHGKFPYVYDLGEEWQKITGLPFVFAVWAIRRDFCSMAPAVVERLVELFHHSRARGLNDPDGIVAQASSKTGLPEGLVANYFDHLVVSLGAQEIKGMQAFFDELYQCGLIPEKTTPAFARAHETLPSEDLRVEPAQMDSAALHMC